MCIQTAKPKSVNESQRTNVLGLSSSEFRNWMQQVSFLTLITFLAIGYILYNEHAKYRINDTTDGVVVSVWTEGSPVVRDVSSSALESRMQPSSLIIDKKRIQFFNRDEVNVARLATTTTEISSEPVAENNVTTTVVTNVLKTIFVEAAVMTVCHAALSIMFPFMAVATRVARLLRSNVRIATRLSRSSLVVTRISRLSTRLWQRMVTFYSRTSASKVITRAKKIVKMILHFDDLHDDPLSLSHDDDTVDNHDNNKHKEIHSDL